MKWTWHDTLSLALIGLLLGMSAWLYPALPDPVPTHWNVHGEADGFTAKPWGAFAGALIILGTWVLLRVVPFISPRGFRMDEFMGVYRIILLATVSVTSVIVAASLLAAAGYGIGMTGFVTALVGLLFIVIGNYMGKVRRNFFIGIRTPWTLASEEVWYRTHRLGGWLFVAAGALTLAGSLAGWGVYVLLPGAIIAALVPVLYSLWVYHRVEGFRDE